MLYEKRPAMGATKQTICGQHIVGCDRLVVGLFASTWEKGWVLLVPPACSSVADAPDHEYSQGDHVRAMLEGIKIPHTRSV
jgi:hypothetical protein